MNTISSAILGKPKYHFFQEPLLVPFRMLVPHLVQHDLRQPWSSLMGSGSGAIKRYFQIQAKMLAKNSLRLVVPVASTADMAWEHDRIDLVDVIVNSPLG